MNEQLEKLDQLIAALTAETRAKTEQTRAIDRLAASNEQLCSLVTQALAEEAPDETDDAAPRYLSGKPVG